MTPVAFDVMKRHRGGGPTFHKARVYFARLHGLFKCICRFGANPEKAFHIR